jgi:hypothetical protein
MSARQMEQTDSLVVLSGAIVLIQIFNARLCMMTSSHLSLIRLGYRPVDVVLTMGRGPKKIAFAQRNAISYLAT